MQDSDLETEARGGGHPDPYKTGRRSPKNLFSALRASVCVKIREGVGGDGVGSPRPSPESATDKYIWAITSSTNEFHFKQTG